MCGKTLVRSEGILDPQIVIAYNSKSFVPLYVSHDLLVHTEFLNQIPYLQNKFRDQNQSNPQFVPKLIQEGEGRPNIFVTIISSISSHKLFSTH